MSGPTVCGWQNVEHQHTSGFCDDGLVDARVVSSDFLNKATKHN